MLAHDPLQAAVAALDSGDRDRAQKLLVHVLREHPHNDQAWVLLAEAVEEPARQRECLERALRLNPANEVARLMLAPAPTDAETVWHHGEVVEVDAETVHGEWSGWDENGHAAATPVAPAPDPEDLRARIERARAAPANLENALALAELGQPSAARHKLREVVKRDPNNEMAWVALIELTDDDEDRERIARDAAHHHPNSPRLAAVTGQAAPVTDSFIAVHTKTPLEMIQDQAAAAGEPIGPIRARRVERGDESQPFFEIWFSALLGPTKGNYQDILDTNRASLLQAATWMGLSGGIAALIQFGLLFLTQPELARLLGQLDRTTLMIATISALVTIWIAPAVGLLLNSVAVSVASVVVGGNIDIRSQAFLTAAWQAPLTLLTSIIAFVPVVNIIGSVAILIYQIVLAISATQAAQDLDGFQAVVALCLSGLVLAVPVCLIGMFAPSVLMEAGQMLQQYAR